MLLKALLIREKIVHLKKEIANLRKEYVECHPSREQHILFNILTRREAIENLKQKLIYIHSNIPL